MSLRWGAAPVDIRGANLPALKARFLVQHAPPVGTVCEVGSGEGKLLRTLARLRPGLTLHGCDVRPPLGGPPTEYAFRPIEGERLPYETGAFDAVLLFDVLEHVPDPARTLAEVARILRPSGKLVAFVPIEGERWSLYALYRRLFGRDLYARTKHHVQAFSHAGLKKLLGAHFVVEKQRYAYHLLGQCMDATFFAAATHPAVRDFWANDNVYYATQASPRPLARALNRALELGNGAAFAESTVLSRARAGSAGLLVTARRHPVRHISAMARFV